jgi:hypothetical protein
LRRTADVMPTGEGLEEDHRRAAVPAHEGGSNGACPGVSCAGFGGQFCCRLMQKLACGSDESPAVGVGEQSIVADADRRARRRT